MEKFDLKGSPVGSYQFPLFTEGNYEPLVLFDFSMSNTPTRIRITYKDPAGYESGICGVHFTIDCSSFTMKFSDLKKYYGAIPDSLVVSEVFNLPPVTTQLLSQASNAFWGIEKHPGDVAWNVSLKKLKALAAYYLIGLAELQPEIMACKLVDRSSCSYAFYFDTVEEPKMFTFSIKITPEKDSDGFLELKSKSGKDTYHFDI